MTDAKMYNAKTYFEQVPVEVARKAARAATPSSQSGQIPCVLCNSPVSLEECKVDERGNPVHDDCYIERLSQLARLNKNRKKD